MSASLSRPEAAGTEESLDRFLRMIDEGFREKLDRIVSEGAEACHFGVCTVRKDLGKECPVITEAAAYLEQRGVRPVRGTH